MNPGFKTLAASLVLAAATGQADAADRHAGKAEMVVPVAFTTDKASDAMRRGAAAESYASDRAVRLYRIESEGAWGESRAAAPVPQSAPSTGSNVAQSDRVSGARKASLPEPGNWGMILVGLLSVGAIARRRMSA